LNEKASQKSLWFPPSSFYTEEKCTCCGVCCGSTDGHPCEFLRRGPDGTFACEIYAKRLGPHKTVDGCKFVCVPIQNVIETTGGYEGCAYVEEIRRIREEMGQPTEDLGRYTTP